MLHLSVTEYAWNNRPNCHNACLKSFECRWIYILGLSSDIKAVVYLECFAYLFENDGFLIHA